jgi:purine nucleoside permease
LPLTDSLPFPNGMRPLRYNPRKHVLGIVAGSGSINTAASIMALGLDPRFDLSKAYWVIAGIAGINPNLGSVGSAAWAEWVVERDLVHEIDAREIPAGWSTGVTPLRRAKPFEGPPPDQGIYSPFVYHLDPALTAWAYGLTKDVHLDDSPALKEIRSHYPGQPEALKPPHVIRGDEVSAMNWWLGTMMNKLAEDWMAYWTGGKGGSVTTAMEDTGVLRSLQFLSQTRLADPRRVMVLRTGSDYSAQGKDETVVHLLEADAGGGGSGALTAYIPALEAAYRAGSPVVNALSSGWVRYRDHPPTVAP